MLNCPVKLKFCNEWPATVVAGHSLKLILKDTYVLGNSFPWQVFYKLYIQDAAGILVWMQENFLDLYKGNIVHFLIPNDAVKYITG